MKIANNIETFWKDVLDCWLKKESLAFVETRKAEGAVLTEKEEHVSRRSYEAGILRGLNFTIDLQPKYRDFLVQMQKDLIANLK